jgi:large exoprotein involved in heme utilization and adhesion
LNIDTESLTLSNGGQLSATTFGDGQGGDIAIQAKTICIDGGFESMDGIYSSKITSQTAAGGNSGNMNIAADSLSLIDGGQISASTFGSGEGGDIMIRAKNILILGGLETSDDITLSMITCQTNPDASGNAGILDIETESLGLSDGGRLVAATFGSGAGGNITITADDTWIDGGFESNFGFYPSMISCQTESTGNAGSLNIHSDSLEIFNGGQIVASTLGNGDGGSIIIEAKTISIDSGYEDSYGFYPSNISCIADYDTGGKAGKIDLQANTLSMSNGGEISVTTYGNEAGGSISIDVRTLNMNSGAVISSASTGIGDAGNIDLTVTDKLECRNSTISTESVHADGGDITICNTGFIVWLIDSAVTATVGGGPETTGGNIRIDSPYVVLNHSQVIANAYEGRGGRIGISAGTYLADWTSTVSASSTKGISGEVNINSPIVDLSGLLSPLPTAFVDISELLANDCETRYDRRKSSSLIVRDRNALPAQPGDLWPSPVLMP